MIDGHILFLPLKEQKKKEEEREKEKMCVRVRSCNETFSCATKQNVM